VTSDAEGPPARYGPFHRLESPTQTADDAKRQEETREVWGAPPRWGHWPKVKAYPGPLGARQRGIEFWTDCEPDIQGDHVSWARGQTGVREEDGYAKIVCVIVKNAQTSREPR
jgi:hypothetical protein